jgi:hypothetical protein
MFMDVLEECAASIFRVAWKNNGMHTVTGSTGTGTLNEPIGVRRTMKE